MVFITEPLILVMQRLLWWVSFVIPTLVFFLGPLLWTHVK